MSSQNNNIKKSLILISTILIFCFSIIMVSGADLVDIENFESYTLGGYGMINESGGEWNCTNAVEYPDCKLLTGIPNDIEGGWNIINLSGNQVLNISTFNGTVANYYRVGLNWYPTPSDSLGNNITIKYKMYIDEYEVNGGAGLLTYQKIIPYNSTKNPMDTYNSIGQVSPENLQFNNYYGSNKIGLCNVTYQTWLNVVDYYYSNGSNQLGKQTYIEGSLCSEDFSTKANNIFPVDLITFQSQMYVTTFFDDIKIYNGIERLTEPEEDLETLLFCPYDNCLFLDDFNYNDNYDLSLENYELNTETAIIKDTNLYLNSSSEIYPHISHNFFYNDTYDTIESFIIFDINGTIPTPSNLENQSITYYLATLSITGTDISLINFAFSKDLVRCDENQTRLSMYSVENGITKTYGYYCYNNNEDITIRLQYLDDEQILKLTAYYESFFSEQFYPESIFTIPYKTSSINFTGFEIGRRDYNNSVNIDFIGIKQISYYGVTDLYYDRSFIYTNETTNDESLVKTDVGEDLQNVAFTLGFKKTSTKILFWFILTGIVLFGVASLCKANNLETQPTTIITTGIIIISVPMGWYLGFIPSVLLAFMIFIVALIGGFMLIKLLSGGD